MKSRTDVCRGPHGMDRRTPVGRSPAQQSTSVRRYTVGTDLPVPTTCWALGMAPSIQPSPLEPFLPSIRSLFLRTDLNPLSRLLRGGLEMESGRWGVIPHIPRVGYESIDRPSSPRGSAGCCREHSTACQHGEKTLFFFPTKTDLTAGPEVFH